MKKFATILLINSTKAEGLHWQQKLLQRYHNILLASSGIEVFGILNEVRTDLIILSRSHDNPLESNEICFRIKNNNATSHIPIILLSDSHDKEILKNYLSSGADEVIFDNFSDNFLCNRINFLLKVKKNLDLINFDQYHNYDFSFTKIEEVNIDNSNIAIFDLNNDNTENIIKNLNNSSYFRSSNILSFNSYSDFLSKKLLKLDVVFINSEFIEKGYFEIYSLLKKDFEDCVIVMYFPRKNLENLYELFDLGIDDFTSHEFLAEDILPSKIINLIKRKKSYKKLKNGINESINMAFKDKLTNLYNRNYFDSYLSFTLKEFAGDDYSMRESESNNSFCLMLIDIDNFKEINDRYGHYIGDFLLKDISDLISLALRSDDLLARYGGEEFLALLKNIRIDQAYKIAQRIKDRVSEHIFKIFNLSFTRTICIGIAEYKEGEDFDAVICKADIAMYEAKNLGRNCVVIYDESLKKNRFCFLEYGSYD